MCLKKEEFAWPLAIGVSDLVQQCVGSFFDHLDHDLSGRPREVGRCKYARRGRLEEKSMFSPLPPNHMKRPARARKRSRFFAPILFFLVLFFFFLTLDGRFVRLANKL